MKLKAYGFDCNLIERLTDFLIGRRHRVVMGNSYSEWRSVDNGVPQDSVLGPLLFLIYINNLPEVVNHFMKLFADDSKLIAIIRDIEDEKLLQKDLDAVCKWVMTGKCYLTSTSVSSWTWAVKEKN